MNLLDRRFLNVSLAVEGIANTPGANPSEGTQYIVGSSGTGAFAGVQPNFIARYDGSVWKFSAPKAGSLEVLNIATGEILQFNGSQWVVKAAFYSPIPPVLAIVPTGATLPVSASAGDTFLHTSDAKLYIATAANTWDNGTITTNGARYASSTDFKIYQSDGSALTSRNILDGEEFLNKKDNLLYVYDKTSSAFVKSTNSSDSSVNSVTDFHTLTAAEVTAKSFSLDNIVATGQEDNILLFVSGVVQEAGTDFTVSGNNVSWDNKGLDSIGLTAGDLFIVHYNKA